MNTKLPTVGDTENEADNGKQGLQELGVVGETNSVMENGVVAVAVNVVAPKDADPTAEGLAVANDC